jgi:hypothetical protein
VEVRPSRVMTVLSQVVYGTPHRTRELEVQRINCHHNFSQFVNIKGD